MNNGGPAFPFSYEEPCNVFEGMSLRDYFAAMAMQGFCANGGRYLNADYSIVAEHAYQAADAMIKARDAASNSQKGET